MASKKESNQANAAKPVSLHPLKFEQAVDKLLKASPQDQKKDERDNRQRRD